MIVPAGGEKGWGRGVAASTPSPTPLGFNAKTLKAFSPPRPSPLLYLFFNTLYYIYFIYFYFLIHYIYYTLYIFIDYLVIIIRGRSGCAPSRGKGLESWGSSFNTAPTPPTFHTTTPTASPPPRPSPPISSFFFF